MAQPEPGSPTEDTPLLESGPEHGVLVRVEQPRPQAARRRRTSCCSLGCCCCAFLAIVVLALIFTFVWTWFVFQVAFSGCPPNNPLCFPWKSSELDYKPVPHPNNVTFAIGFHFTAGYGTAAIYYRNGTNVTVGRHEGDRVYKDYMAAISLHEAEHPTPPYYGTGRASTDAHRQWNRYYRKRAGNPPSNEVEALVNVLNGLKPSINQILGNDGPFEYATTAVPALPAMYNENLVDAAKYAGVQLTIAGRASRDASQYPMSDVNFALSGMNLTLKGKDTWHGKMLPSVGYTRDMLTAHVCPNGCDSYYAFYLSSQGIADPLLGSNARSDNELEEDYWSRVSDAIRRRLILRDTTLSIPSWCMGLRRWMRDFEVFCNKS